MVTAIERENGKCVDFEVMSKHCKSCQHWSSKKDNPAYNKWEEEHICPINHTGSAGSMETAGAINIFKRSIAFNGLRYKRYIGDGDSSAFQKVADSNPYPDLQITKGECVGHIQKRVGSRLRKLKERNKKKLSDGKGLNGKGRLTEKVINTLQNYYGMAIRHNKGELYAMKKSVAAVLFHCTDYDDKEFRHRFCLRTADSWCKYQSDKITGKSTYKSDKIDIPVVISNEIKPIFTELSKDSLLEKCLHGQTQNVNESLNGFIWKRCPKDIFVSRQVLEICVASSVLSFNDAANGLLHVMKKLNLDTGAYNLNGSKQKDLKRIRIMNYKTSASVKKRRKKLRSIRKGYTDNDNEKEEITYKAGCF